MPQEDHSLAEALVSEVSVQETLVQTFSRLIEASIAHSPFIVAGIVVLVITALLAPFSDYLVHKMMSQSRRRESFVDLIALLSRIAIWVIGITVASMLVFPGLTPTKALGGLGIASVAIGLAFRDIFENFFAGILLLWKFPFEKGDWIECGDISGRVEDITVRMTALRTVRDELIVVPNSVLYKNSVNILTMNSLRRMEIMAGIAYDENVEEAVPVIEQAVRSCPSVSDDKPVQIFPNAFGASSIDIEVAWWTGSTPLERRRSRGEVVTAIKAALDQAGIEIPYPYRTLVFKDNSPLSMHHASTPDEG